MKARFIGSGFFLLLFLFSCSKKDQAQQIIDQSINHYFPTGLEYKKVSFDFRGRTYTTSRWPDQFIYTRSFEDSLGYIEDILMNSVDLVRTIDQDTVELDPEWREKYTSSVNSVLYFFQIPYVLNDPAAIKKLTGETEINGKIYWSVSVTFEKQQGGEDYDDEFLYFVDKDDFSIDYLAYNYSVDGGGVRFREAFNQRRIDGLLFQDYINYEVEIGTPLSNIPQLFKDGKLKELSKIVNENIKISQLR